MPTPTDTQASAVRASLVEHVCAQAAVFLVVLDRELKLLWANRYAYGHDEASLLGRRVDTHVHPDDRPRWLADMHAALGGETREGCFRNVGCADLPNLRMHYLASPLRLHGMEIDAVLIICRPVAERLGGRRATDQPELLPMPREVRRPFVPNTMQEAILEALDGAALTTDALAAAAGYGRRTLFRKPGGIDELMERGLIANDGDHSGYYRPDAPPQ